MSLSLFLTIYFWVFLIFVVGFLSLAFIGPFITGLNKSRDFSGVRFWLAKLLHSGYESGLLRIQGDSGRSLLFRKYIRSKGKFGLELCCTTVAWSDEERRRMQRLADERELPHKLELQNLDGTTLDALVVDCGQDRNKAYALAIAAWTEIFGLSAKAPHSTEIEGYSTLNERIDGPYHPPPFEDHVRVYGWESAKIRWREAGAPKGKTIALAVLLLPLMLSSAVGLPITTLMSRGDAPDWTVQLHAVALGGDTAALAFFVILTGSYCALRRLNFGDRQWAAPFDTLERRLYRIQRALVFTLPIAVLLVWAGF